MKDSALALIKEKRPDYFAELLRPFSTELVRIEPLRPHRFSANAQAWNLGDVKLFRVTMERAKIVAPPINAHITLSIPLDGIFTCENGAMTVEPGKALLRDESAPMDVVLPTSTTLVANFDAHRLHETAGLLCDGHRNDQFRTPPILSLSSPSGIQLWRQLALVWRELSKGAAWLDSSMAMSEVSSQLTATLTTLLLPETERYTPPCSDTTVRRVEEYIAAHLNGPISRADLCAVAGCCERSLSRAFHHSHGIGPMSFLKQRRLDAAQRLLLAAHPSQRSVTEIATACGLFHLGRFSLEYARAFGESPSETLSR